MHGLSVGSEPISASMRGLHRFLCEAVAAVPFQWSTMMGAQGHRAQRGLMAEFSVVVVDARAAHDVERKQPTVSDCDRLEPHVRVRELVESAVTRAIGKEVRADASLMEEGLDSLAAVELGGALQKDTGVSIPATLAFDYPTTNAIVGYLEDALRDAWNDSNTNNSARVHRNEQEQKREQRHAHGVSLASVGEAMHPASRQMQTSDVGMRERRVRPCVISLSRHSNMLSYSLQNTDVDMCLAMPAQRIDVDAPYPNVNAPFVVRHAATLAHVSAMDTETFSIPSVEAKLMDPQQRVLLENTCSAVRVSGEVPHQSCAVAVGAWVSQYGDLCRAYSPAPGPYSGVASALSVLCGRLSYTFGMRGPSACVDTACSSSLVAAHLASSYMHNRECTDAIIAGVSVNVGIGTFRVAAAASMLSMDGRCKTLDVRADGYAKGECCVVLRIIANNADAVSSDEDTRAQTRAPLAYVTQTGVNQDGRSSSLTAPNGPSQQALVSDVLVRAGVRGDMVGRLEMHGTGTALGDPIEVGAALEVLRCACERTHGGPTGNSHHIRGREAARRTL
jgi:acyl carrier protein